MTTERQLWFDNLLAAATQAAPGEPGDMKAAIRADDEIDPNQVLAWMQRLSGFATYQGAKLAHPSLYPQVGDLLPKIFPHAWEDIRRLRKMGVTPPIGSLVDWMMETPLAQVLEEQAKVLWPNVPARAFAHVTLANMLMSSWHREMKGAVMQVTRPLLEMLEMTDVERIPLRYYRSPFESVYIRMPTQLDQPEEASPSQVLPCEGFYLYEDNVNRDAQGNPTVATSIVPVQMRQSYDALHVPSLITRIDLDGEGDEERTLEEWLGTRGADLENGSVRRDTAYRTLVGKVLLYLNSVEMRGDREEKTWTKSTNAPESVRRAFKGSGLNPIIVGPMRNTAEAGHAANGRTMPVHWRRGHFRHVRYGEGRSESRLVLIRPVLVNAAKLSGEAPAKKAYRLGPRGA